MKTILMIKTMAKVISYLFPPLLMPFLGIVLIFNSGSYLTYYPFEGQKAIYTIVLLSTIVLPLCFIPFFMFFKFLIPKILRCINIFHFFPFSIIITYILLK